MKKSKDMAADAAVSVIRGFKSSAELRAFVSENEDRVTVLKAAEAKMADLVKSEGEAHTKQGEQSGPMTQETSEFKSSGVEGKKHITIEDVLKSRKK
jgi:hypothetical protein